MKRWVCKEFGNYDSLELVEEKLPNIQPDEVLIKLAACSLNFPDLLIIENKYQYKPDGAFTPGGEGSGIVEEMGSAVKDLKVGQAVFFLERWGGLSEKIVLKANRVFPLQRGVDLLTGASALYTYSTAFYALKDKGRAKSGETLLVTGAGGGIGIAAIQLAKALGLEVIAAAGSDEKLAWAKTHGADYLVDYNTENLREKVKEYTEGKGVNLVLDTVGGEYAENCLRSLAPYGRYLVVGFAAGSIPQIALNWVLLKSAQIIGIFWGKWAREMPHKQAENITRIQGLLVESKINTYVGEKYNFDQADRAIRNYKNQKVLGKTLVICDPEILNSRQEVTASEVVKTVFTSRDQLLAGSHKVLGESRPYQITQEMIDDFAHTTEDRQWIHINPKMAAKTPFRGTVAHGYLVLALASNFLAEILEVPFAKMALNYGLDKVRFIAPVPVNSRIKMTARIVEAEETKQGAVKVKIEATFLNASTYEQVCFAELISVIY